MFKNEGPYEVGVFLVGFPRLSLSQQFDVEIRSGLALKYFISSDKIKTKDV